MFKVDSAIIDECAENLLFKISEEEKKVTLEEFDAIIKQMSFLGDIQGIDKAAPLTFPVNVTQDVLREDIPCEPLDVNKELQMVPNRLGNQVKLPKVIG